MKDVLSIAQFDRDGIEKILMLSESFKEVITREIKKVPVLRGRTVINFFVEPSTRTRTSFELAAKRLSADVINMTAKSSSLAKGESLIDTAKTIEALGADAIVIRHPLAGSAELFAGKITPAIINAGDGAHEHPTQALIDLYTLKKKFGSLSGLKVGIVGDIAHSRVARSNILAFKMMGADVVAIGPSIMMPPRIEELGVTVSHDFDSMIAGLDVVYMLRIQSERERETFALMPSIKEYSKMFALDQRRVSSMKKGAVIMHPGPMNAGVEISLDALNERLSTVWSQVSNGVAVRMAVLYYALGGGEMLV
ncbi:MAG: aspartate carbamoyltransferase catalytic subunit [Actinomycetota bacterium]|nr:aspartate carbamoyltransferase catalytic subunit [Actinomycetota bacterium]